MIKQVLKRIFAPSAPPVVAAEGRSVTDSGYCGSEGDGTNLTWILYEDGELVVSGTGEMGEGYGGTKVYFGEVPWSNYRDHIIKVTIEDGVTGIGAEAFSYCAQMSSVAIGKSVTSIGEYAFSFCKKLTSVTLPNGVTDIGWGAFDSCTSLVRVTMPNSVTNISGEVFSGCTSLPEIELPDSVRQIGDNAFCGCNSLRSIVIPSGVVSLERAFQNCEKLAHVTIPEGVTNISGAFVGCENLESITIPNSVMNISGAFSGCTSLTSIIIPDGVTSIGSHTFYNCAKLSSLTIPACVTSMGEYAFYGCTNSPVVHYTGDLASWCAIDFQYASELENYANPLSCAGALYIDGKRLAGQVTIPDTVTGIGQLAFSGCDKLSGVMIPDSVRFISDGAFWGCRGLSRIEFLGDAPTLVGTDALDTGGDLSIAYHKGTIGWQDSAYYDAAAGTWCGHPLKLTEQEEELAGTITHTGYSLSVEDAVFINLYVTFSGFEGIDLANRGGLLVWNSPVTEDEAVYGTAQTTHKGLIACGGEYTQRTAGIPMRRYADPVYARVYIKTAQGKYVYGPLTEYSVQQYCEHKITTQGYGAKLKATCAAMLHLGAMAQQYFNYNTNDLANANILEVCPPHKLEGQVFGVEDVAAGGAWGEHELPR